MLNTRRIRLMLQLIALATIISIIFMFFYGSHLLPRQFQSNRHIFFKSKSVLSGDNVHHKSLINFSKKLITTQQQKLVLTTTQKQTTKRITKSTTIKMSTAANPVVTSRAVGKSLPMKTVKTPDSSSNSKSIVNSGANKIFYKNTKCECISFQQLANAQKLQYGIPKILHYHYKGLGVPIEFYNLINKCRKVNEDMNVVLWTPESIEALIKEPNFPKDRVDVFNTYKNDKMEGSDVARNHFLYKFGGVYMDMDFECNKAMTEIMSKYRCILDREHLAQGLLLYGFEESVMTSLMGCAPNHPFFKRHVWSQPKNPGHGHILSKTGPHRLTRSYKAYMQLYSNVTNNPASPYSLKLASWKFFSPAMDDGVFNSWEGRCTTSTSPGCVALKDYARTREEDLKNAYSIHKFLHLGYAGAEANIQIYHNLCEKDTNLKVVHETCKF